MQKVNDDFLVWLWAVPRSVAAGGSTDSELVRKHPLTRWLCKQREGSDVVQDRPDNPPDVTGLTVPERIGKVCVAHMAEQVALGATPATCAFFIQHFGDTTGYTTAMFRSPDDAVGIDETGDDNYNAVYCDKAVAGSNPTPVTGKVPCKTAFAEYLDEIAAELDAAELDEPGWFHMDTEALLEPWQLCKTDGGTYDLNVADARYTTEIVCEDAHRVGGASGSGDLTFEDWEDEAVARTPGYAPDADATWSTGTNLSSGSTQELLRMRRDICQSRFAASTKDILAARARWAGTKVTNYEMTGNDNPDFPAHRSSFGRADTDHNAGFFGLDADSPICYNNVIYDGPSVDDVTVDPDFLRFSPNQRIGPGRNYDEIQMFGVLLRYWVSCRASSVARPFIPWVRGCDIRGTDVQSSVPGVLGVDLGRTLRFCRALPNCPGAIVWVNDNDPSYLRWDRTVEALALAFPEYRVNAAGTDWEAAA